MTERGRCSARTLSRPIRRFLRLQRMRFRTRPWPLPLPPLMRTRTRHAIKSATSSCTQALTFPTASSAATARPSLIWLRIIRNSTQFWVRMSYPAIGRFGYGSSPPPPPAFFKNGNGFDSVFYCCVRVQPCHFRLLHTDKFFVVQLAVGGVGNVRNHSRAYGVA